MNTDELIEEIKQILEANDEGKMQGMEAIHTIFVLTNPHKSKQEFNGNEKVILLRDGTLITGMTNEIAQEYKDMDFLYMGDLKGITERFADVCPACPNCNLPMTLERENHAERTFVCGSCDVRDKFCKKCKLEQSICSCQ